MHSNFDFSASQILWTLTFAALLVLLVVLFGRDRARRFPWFTASILTMGMLLLTTQLMLSRLPRMAGTEIFLALSDLDVVIGLAVLVELAQHAFKGAGKLGWIIGTLGMLAVAAPVLVMWGPWPAWKTLTANSEIVTIRLMDLTVDKGILLAGVLTVELGLLITLFGRRFGAGWRSHTQRIMIGLSTAAIGQLVLRASLQAMGMHSHIATQADYDRVMALRNNLIHANNALFLCVMAWWIGCLWIDDPDEPSNVLPAEAEAESGAESEAAPTEATPSESSEVDSNKASQPESSGTKIQD